MQCIAPCCEWDIVAIDQSQYQLNSCQLLKVTTMGMQALELDHGEVEEGHLVWAVQFPFILRTFGLVRLLGEATAQGFTMERSQADRGSMIQEMFGRETQVLGMHVGINLSELFWQLTEDPVYYAGDCDGLAHW